MGIILGLGAIVALALYEAFKDTNKAQAAEQPASAPPVQNRGQGRGQRSQAQTPAAPNYGDIARSAGRGAPSGQYAPSPAPAPVPNYADIARSAGRGAPAGQNMEPINPYPDTPPTDFSQGGVNAARMASAGAFAAAMNVAKSSQAPASNAASASPARVNPNGPQTPAPSDSPQLTDEQKAAAAKFVTDAVKRAKDFLVQKDMHAEGASHPDEMEDGKV